MKQARERIERRVSKDLKLLSMEPADFHRATIMELDADSAPCAGDALHLACAKDVQANQVATLDAVMARNAQLCKIKPVEFAGWDPFRPACATALRTKRLAWLLQSPASDW